MPIRVIGQGFPQVEGYSYDDTAMGLGSVIGNLFKIPHERRRLELENKAKEDAIEDRRLHRQMTQMQIDHMPRQWDMQDAEARSVIANREADNKRQNTSDLFNQNAITNKTQYDRKLQQDELTRDESARRDKDLQAGYIKPSSPLATFTRDSAVYDAGVLDRQKTQSKDVLNADLMRAHAEHYREANNPKSMSQSQVANNESNLRKEYNKYAVRRAYEHSKNAFGQPEDPRITQQRAEQAVATDPNYEANYQKWRAIRTGESNNDNATDTDNDTDNRIMGDISSPIKPMRSPQEQEIVAPNRQQEALGRVLSLIEQAKRNRND